MPNNASNGDSIEAVNDRTRKLLGLPSDPVKPYAEKGQDAKWHLERAAAVIRCGPQDEYEITMTSLYLLAIHHDLVALTKAVQSLTKTLAKETE
jgi:hypothetical protein